VSLTNVWLRTLDDEIIRADQVVGIHSHYTPALVGKPACWLLDVFLLTPLGNGRPDGRGISALHRTLIQTPHAPTGAPATLARLLAQLDAIHATGVITTTIATVAPATSDTIAESDSTDMQIATSAPPLPVHPLPRPRTRPPHRTRIPLTTDSEESAPIVVSDTS
jgi:hypothetical protein